MPAVLEAQRPDVVLVDISTWKDSLEVLSGAIRGAIGDPMIIAINTSANSDAILASMRAGINEYLYPPLQESLRRALEKRSVERSRRRDGSTKGAGKAFSAGVDLKAAPRLYARSGPGFQ